MHHNFYLMAGLPSLVHVNNPAIVVYSLPRVKIIYYYQSYRLLVRGSQLRCFNLKHYVLCPSFNVSTLFRDLLSKSMLYFAMILGSGLWHSLSTEILCFVTVHSHCSHKSSAFWRSLSTFMLCSVIWLVYSGARLMICNDLCPINCSVSWSSLTTLVLYHLCSQYGVLCPDLL